MHYVLSFCKVTAASKIFSRNFYLPLLKPLTPQDALRTFRITGKWLLGSKMQHYIPVLLNHTKKRSQKLKNYGKIKHEIVEDFAYMTPMLDPQNIESHKNLCNILSAKAGKGRYVYSVDDKNYNLVVEAPLEIALRDGDVIDIVMSQGTDKILVKLKDFKKIPVEIYSFVGNGTLFKGEGATTKEDERHHHHGKNTMSIAKIFEDMERKEELWELELKRLLEKRKRQYGEGTKEWTDMVKAATANMDWKKYEKQVKRLVQYIEEPIVEYHIGMEVEDLNKTAEIAETLNANGPKILTLLPTLQEIPELINNMSEGAYYEFEIDGVGENASKRIISGVKVTLPSGNQRFVIGQMVKSEEGEIFVSGQTIENEFGTEYVPGITINAENQPVLISGLIVGEAENKNPMFVPIESSITKDWHLSFTTTKEERLKYRPRKVPVRKVLKSLAQNPDECYEEYYYDDEGLEDFDYEAPTKIKKKLRRVIKRRKVAPQGCVYNVQDEDLYEEEEYSEYEEVDDLEEECLSEILQDEVLSLGESFDQSVQEPSITEPTLEEIIEKYKKEVDPRIKVHRELIEEERIMIKVVNAKITELIVNIETKTEEVKERLEELRNLTVVQEISPVSIANPNDVTEIATSITNHSHEINIISEILLAMVKKIFAFNDRNSIKVYNINSPSALEETNLDLRTKRREKLKIILKTAMIAANNVFKNRPQDEVSAVKAIGTVLILALEDQDKLVVELCEVMKEPLERNEIVDLLLKELTQKYRKDKLKTLKSVINTNAKDIDESSVVEKFRDILERKGDLIGLAFKKVAKNKTDLVQKVIELVKYDVDNAKNERYAIQALKEAIVNAIRKIAEDDLHNLVKNAKDGELKDLIADAVYFSHFLNLNGIADDLQRLPQNYNLISASSKECVTLLNRLMIIRRLAESDRGQTAALKEIRKNPEFGKTNPRIRQLIRESASLVANINPIQNSKEIPARLMNEKNLIALEDFLIQRSRSELPIMISKNGRQVVIPREVSSDVLQGRVPYLLLDEEGVNNIQAAKKFKNLVINDNYKEKPVEDYSPFGTKQRLNNKNNNKWAEVPNFNKTNVRNRIRETPKFNGRIAA